MKYMKSLTLLALGLTLVSCGSSLSNPTGGSSGTNLDVTTAGTNKPNDLDASDKQSLLNLINATRASGYACPGPVGFQAVVAAVAVNDKLELMALKHTNVLLYKNVDFAKTDPHSGVGDGTVATRAANVAYAYLTVGENIAAGQLNVNEVMNDWLASPDHCKNLMDKDYTQIGVAKLNTNAGAYATYWTLNFGKPK
jgi:uncharacterized protein YkwD